MTRQFNWEPNFDERSRDFPIRASILSRPRKRNKTWRLGPILDQGSEGACVGFGWSADAFATPVAVDLTRMREVVPQDPNQFALHLYATAKTLDNWDGEDYSGTSVLAGARAMQQFGLVKEYRWAFSMADVIDSILTKGPVVLGIDWYESMYDAPNGVLSVAGELVGGHCITAVGYRVASPLLDGEDGIVLQNSWGADWGTNGTAVITISDLAKLLQNGEACVPLRKSFGR